MRDHHVTAALVLALAAGTTFGADWATGTGNWPDPANWNPMDVPDTSGETAVFPGMGGPYTVTLSGLSPTLSGLELQNTDPTINVAGGATITMDGNVDNNGLIRLNHTGSSLDGLLTFDANLMLDGTGMIEMVRPGGDSRITTTPGFSVTQGANHTIIGRGSIDASLINNGTVSASTGTLELQVEDKMNNSVMEALLNSTLQVEDITLSQSAPGVLIARDGGTVDLIGTNQIITGSLMSEGSGKVRRRVGTSTIEGVRNEGNLDVEGGGYLSLTGNGMTNNGVIVLNNNGSSLDAHIECATSCALNGTGTLIMNRPNGDSQVSTLPGQILTHAADHTIEGRGQIPANLINNGLITANLSTSTLTLLQEDKVNNALMSATNNAALELTGFTLTQGANGRLLGDGGAIVFTGSSTIIDGFLDSDNGGFIERRFGETILDSVINEGDLDIEGGGVIAMINGLTNRGVISINTNGSSSNAFLRCDDNSTLSGNGEVHMLRPGADCQLATAMGARLTIGPNQLVHGRGEIPANLVNNGMIEADGGTSQALVLLDSDKVNNNLMSATGLAILETDDIAITQGPNGMILADNATVGFDGEAVITNGSIATVNMGQAVVRGTGDLFLDGVTFTGTMNMLGGSEVIVINNDFINDGSIVVNSNGSSANVLFRFDSDVSVVGTGEILMNRFGADSTLATDKGVTGTIGPDQTVRGHGLITATLNNTGLISAEDAGNLELETGPKMNSGVMQALLGGTLEIGTVDVTQTPAGMTVADEGLVLFTSTNTFTGGILTTTNGGIVRRISGGVTALTSTTISGDFEIYGGGVVDLDDCINNGTITVNANGSSADGQVRAATDTALTGTGRIVLARPGNDSQLHANGFTLTNEAGHTIEGSGTVRGGFVNQGDVLANIGLGMVLDAEEGGWINEGLIEVSGLGGMSITGDTFDNQSTFNSNAGSGKISVNSGYFQSAGVTNLNGEIESNSPSTIAGGVLMGEGLFDGPLVIDGGAVAPGNSAGTLNVEGTYTQTAAGTYDLEHGGTDMGEADRIAVTGTAELDGPVDVTFIEGYTPSTGDSIVILTASNGYTGEFSAINAPDISPNVWYLVYDQTSVSLVATCVGDIDGSGSVNFDDLSELLDQWATSGTAADVDGSGFVDFEDLSELLDQWAVDCP